MSSFFGNIEKLTLENKNFRKVVFTGPNSQLVLMSLLPQEDIGVESHNVDQFFRFEQGVGEVTVDDKVYPVVDGDAVVVPANAVHNVKNTSQIEELKFYTIYSPANHPDNTVHATKKEALEDEEDHH